jgi:hypothetical protein
LTEIALDSSRGFAPKRHIYTYIYVYKHTLSHQKYVYINTQMHINIKANIEAAESLTEIALDSSRGFAPKRHWGKALTVVTGVVRVSLIVKR